MIFEDKKIILKDGRTAIFKNPCIEDAEKMLHYIKKACGETDFLLRYPEEWNGATVESEERWIQSRLDAPSVLAITCFVDGEIAGNCELLFRSGIKASHRATVAIAILKDYWNLGIGSAMFREMIAAAEANPATEIMELEFVEGNRRAQALYEKFGFHIVGSRPRAFKLKDGRMLGEYFMQKELRRTSL